MFLDIFFLVFLVLVVELGSVFWFVEDGVGIWGVVIGGGVMNIVFVIG